MGAFFYVVSSPRHTFAFSPSRFRAPRKAYSALFRPCYATRSDRAPSDMALRVAFSPCSWAMLPLAANKDSRWLNFLDCLSGRQLVWLSEADPQRKLKVLVKLVNHPAPPQGGHGVVRLLPLERLLF